MKRITTYSAHNASVLVWLAVLLMTASAVTRIAFFSGVGRLGLGVVFLHIILPAAANLIYAIRLPLNGEKMFYVTITPTFLACVYFFCISLRLNIPVYMTIILVFFCAAQYVLFSLTFKGKISSKLPVLAAWVLPAVWFAVGPTFRYDFVYILQRQLMLVVSDLALYAGIVIAILSARRLPDPVEGEAYRLRWGDRPDGRLIRSTSAMSKLNPYFMPYRNGATNFIADAIEISAMERYIRQKRREGLKHFGITHVILAAYVRTCAELPGINRYLSGQKVYHRFNIDVSMVIKKDMENDAPDTVIKCHFDPADTAADVYRKYDEVLQSVRTPELDSGFDKATNIIDIIPGLLKKFGIWCLTVMDYFGVLPGLFKELSPFHASLFITSMGSLGIPPIYHHLYDFGNCPVFCSFGCKRTAYELDSEGNVQPRKYVDIKWVTDERIVDGFYYASVMKRMRSLMLHPERLDEVHEVTEDIL